MEKLKHELQFILSNSERDEHDFTPRSDTFIIFFSKVRQLFDLFLLFKSKENKNSISFKQLKNIHNDFFQMSEVDK